MTPDAVGGSEREGTPTVSRSLSNPSLPSLKEARELLKVPVFGNERCILALKVLQRYEEASKLRLLLNGRKVQCWCCEGRGEIDCRAGCSHECPTCQGENKLRLTPELLSDLYLEQLRDLIQEVGITA
jgi:hypothetical protein